MMRNRLSVARPRLLVVVSLLLALAVVPSPSSAACERAFDAFVTEMPVAFVGTVASTRAARVQLDVAQVWRGPDLARRVWVVDGGSDGGDPVSVDWVGGERFVVLADEDFQTTECTAKNTDEIARLAALAPTTVRAPVDGGSPGAPPPLGAGIVALGLAVVVAGALAVARVARPAYRSRRRSRQPASANSPTV